MYLNYKWTGTTYYKRICTLKTVFVLLSSSSYLLTLYLFFSFSCTKYFFWLHLLTNLSSSFLYNFSTAIPLFLRNFLINYCFLVKKLMMMIFLRKTGLLILFQLPNFNLLFLLYNWLYQSMYIAKQDHV